MIKIAFALTVGTVVLASSTCTRPFLPFKDIPPASFCKAVTSDENCRPSNGDWAVAQYAPPYAVANSAIKTDTDSKAALVRQFLMAAWPQAGRDQCMAWTDESLNGLLDRFEFNAPTGTAADQIVVETSLTSVQAELDARLKGKVSPTLAGSISTKFHADLLERLRNSNAVRAPQAPYVQVWFKDRLGAGSGAIRRFPALKPCSGKSVAIGIALLEVRDLVLNGDNDVASTFTTSLNFAMEGVASLTPEAKGQISAGLSTTFTKELKSHITVTTSYLGQTLYYPLWMKYDTIND